MQTYKSFHWEKLQDMPWGGKCQSWQGSVSEISGNVGLLDTHIRRIQLERVLKNRKATLGRGVLFKRGGS